MKKLFLMTVLMINSFFWGQAYALFDNRDPKKLVDELKKKKEKQKGQKKKRNKNGEAIVFVDPVTGESLWQKPRY